MPYTFTVMGRFKMVQSLSVLSLSAVSDSTWARRHVSRPNCSRPKGNVSLSSIDPYICPSTLLRTMSLSNGTFLKRPWTGLCFGHLTKKDIHMLLLRTLCKLFGDEGEKGFLREHPFWITKEITIKLTHWKWNGTWYSKVIISDYIFDNYLNNLWFLAMG